MQKWRKGSYSNNCAFVGISCLCYDDQHFSITLLYNTSLQHFSTTLLYIISLQHFSPTILHNTSLQHTSTTLSSNTSLQQFSSKLLYNILLQQSSTTLLYKTSHNAPSQHFSTTLPNNTSLQRFCITLHHKTSLHHFSTALRRGMAVTCDHRIRSLATTNKKTGFGSLVTTKCGHLRPQNVTFADRANKTSTVHAVTCDHTSRSLATKNWDHLASLGSLVPMHGVGGVGGGWDDNVPCTCTHTSRTHHLYPCTGWVGWVGWDDNVPCTCTHTSRTHHLYPCARWNTPLGRGGWAWVGWVG